MNIGKVCTRFTIITFRSDWCWIEEVEGFLKYRCPPVRDNGYKWFKCHNSEEYYFDFHLYNNPFRGELCSNDTYYYQACDTRLKGFQLTDTNILCGNWLCSWDDPHRKERIYSAYTAGMWICDGEQFCEDNRDEANCTAKTIDTKSTLRSGEMVESSLVCDDKCDISSCEDEANCNGLTYGLYCKVTIYLVFNFPWRKTVYIPPRQICDDIEHCDGGVDEVGCRVTEQTKHTCRHYWTKKVVPVFNYTRCAIPGGIYNNRYFVDEDLNKYQTNCTDQARVGVSCFIDGYISSVSIKIRKAPRAECARKDMFLKCSRSPTFTHFGV